MDLALLAHLPFLYRIPTGLVVKKWDGTVLLDVAGSFRLYVLSKDGKYVALCSANQGKVSLPNRTNAIEMSFSPRSGYLQIWERPAPGSTLENAALVHVASGKEILSAFQRSQESWRMEWAADEKFFVRSPQPNALEVFNPQEPSSNPSLMMIPFPASIGPIYHGIFDGMKAFSIAPQSTQCVRLAVFIGERNGSPASVRLFHVPHFSTPVAMKSFFQAERVSLYWNHAGTSLLVLAQTDMDKTGKSYYGGTHLVYLSGDGKFDCLVKLDREGPIHDIAWRPGANEFVVVYGFMPAQVTLFDGKCQPIHSFGTGSKNFVKFNRQGNLLALAGFGNLAGQLDIYTLETKTGGNASIPMRGKTPPAVTEVRSISSFQAPGTTTLEWSPSGRHLLMATLSPRLRVDNGLKIFHYHGGGGKPVYQADFKELNQADWLPSTHSETDSFTVIDPSFMSLGAALSYSAGEKKSVYIPPSKRGLSIQPCPVGLDKPNVYVKKSYVSPTRSVCAEDSPLSHASQSPIYATEVPKTSAAKPVLSQKEKLVKNISEKLDQIKRLKEKQDQGLPLELNQLDKIAKEVDLLKQLNQLTLDT